MVTHVTIITVDAQHMPAGKLFGRRRQAKMKRCEEIDHLPGNSGVYLRKRPSKKGGCNVQRRSKPVG
jgi:hypothetical protein